MKTFVTGLLGLLTVVGAAPLQERSLIAAYGDRSDYASAYNAGHPAPTNAPWSGSSGSGSSPPSGSTPPQGSSQYQDGWQDTPVAPTQASDKPFSLTNGFPNVKNPSQQLTDINQAARGTLSNAPPPAKGPSEETLTSLRLVAFNELFEVFYFTELLSNVTNNVPGYQFQDEKYREKIIKVLTAVQAQEELHALNANGALNRFNAGPIQACQYNAPVDNFHDAIFLASTFTDVVLGTLADISVVSRCSTKAYDTAS